jgi:hypothetical protein
MNSIIDVIVHERDARSSPTEIGGFGGFGGFDGFDGSKAWAGSARDGQ